MTRLTRIERRQGQRAHRVEARRRAQHFRYRIHDDGRRRDVAVDAARDLLCNAGRTLNLDRIVGLRRAQIRFHVQPDHRLPLAIPNTVLNDPAHVAGIHGEELARDRDRGQLRLNLVRDPIERPAEGIGDHRDRFRQPHVPHGAVVDFLLKLFGREPRADLLLERQAANPRVLNAVHGDAIHALADGGERDRQRIHREPGVHAGAEHADFRLLRHRVNLPRQPNVRVTGVRQLLGGRHDRGLRFEDRFNLRHHLLDRRARAEDHHISLGGFQCLGRIGGHLHAKALRQTDHVAQVAADLDGIDVDGADYLESRTCGDLFDDGGPNRSKPEMHHANVGHSRELYSPSMPADHPGGLTRDHVIWAYRLLLDRDPENEDVIAPKLAGSGDTRELRHHLMTSAEFRRKNLDYAHTNDRTIVITELETPHGPVRLFVDLAD